MSGETSTGPRKKNANRVIAGVCIAFFGGMIGMAYAAVPLYRMFCQATGYGGTTQRAEKQYAGRVLDRDITVRFDANTNGIPWQFEPVARSVTIKIGATTQAHYSATNKFDRPITGRATFNVQPEMAGAYFNKVECFCFTEARRDAGHACRVLCRSRHRQCAGTEGLEDHHPVLHHVPGRKDQAGRFLGAGP